MFSLPRPPRRARPAVEQLENRDTPAAIRFDAPLTDDTGGTNPFQPRAAFLNDDGFADLVVAHREGQSLSVLLGDGTGHFALTQTLSFPPKHGEPPLDPLAFPFDVAFADLTGDGKLDMAVAGGFNADVRFFAGDGAGHFTEIGTPIDLFGSGPSVLVSSLALGNFDGSGPVDLAVFYTTATDGFVSVYRGLGGGNFALIGTDSAAKVPPVYDNYFLAAADLTGDGVLEVIVPNYTRDSVTVLRNDGLGNLTPERYTLSVDGPVTVAVADFDGDQKLDFAVSGYVGGQVAVYLNDGTGLFAEAGRIDVSPAYGPYGLAAADYDGDGNADLAVGNYGGGDGFVKVYRGNGDGSFTAEVGPVVLGPALGLVSADFNGDNKADLAAALFRDTGSANLAVLLNSTGPVAADLTLASSKNPSTYGEAVTFTATVTGDRGTPTGTVQFYVGGVAVGGPVALVNGKATYTTSALNAGQHAVTAVYSGDDEYTTDTAGLTQTVNKAPTATVVVSSNNPSQPGQAVTFTATVTSPGGVPTGTVDFYADGVKIGSGTLDANGVATFTTDDLPPGSHAITAVYAGDDNFLPSQDDLDQDQVVAAVNSTVGLQSSKNPSVFGDTVTFTATVAGPSGTPTGTIQFFIDGVAVGGPVTLAGGVATLTLDSLTAGNHTVTAVYSGDATYSAGSASLVQVVAKAPTATAVVVVPSSPAVGQPVTLTATVTSPAGVPPGVVEFYVDGVLVGTAPVNGKGVATLVTGPFAVGGHAVTAIYVGSANYLASQSPAVPFAVAPAATTTTLTAKPSPSVVGQLVRLRAVVAAAPGAGGPTGRVDFYADGVFLGSAAVNGGVAVLDTAKLGLGPHLLKAVFVPNTASFTGSSGQTTHAVVEAGGGQEQPPIDPPTVPEAPPAGGGTDNPGGGGGGPQRVRRYAIGAGLGGGPHVRVIDPVTGAEAFSFYAYPQIFTGGVSVASADVTGDGVDDIITGAGPGGGPVVSVFDGVTGQLVRSFYAYLPSFVGGVTVAGGDVDGDGYADVITGAGHGGGPHVQVFSGKDGSLMRSFFAYLEIFVGGVTVGSGDADGDGRSEVITGAGQYGGPHVVVWDGATGAAVRSFFAFNPVFLGGVWVSGGNAADGSFVLSVGAGYGGPPIQHVFRGPEFAHTDVYQPYPTPLQGGVRTGLTVAGGQLLLVMGAGPGGGPHVKTHDAASLGEVSSYFGFPVPFHGRLRDLGLTPPFTMFPDNPFIDLMGGVYVG